MTLEMTAVVEMTIMISNNVEEEYKRIRSLGYDNFKVNNGEVVYKVLGKSLFKIKAPE